MCACVNINQLFQDIILWSLYQYVWFYQSQLWWKAYNFSLYNYVNIVWPKTTRTYQKHVMCTWGVHIAVHRVKIHHSNEMFTKVTNQKSIHFIQLWSGVKNPLWGLPKSPTSPWVVQAFRKPNSLPTPLAAHNGHRTGLVRQCIIISKSSKPGFHG